MTVIETLVKKCLVEVVSFVRMSRSNVLQIDTDAPIYTKKQKIGIVKANYDQ